MEDKIAEKNKRVDAVLGIVVASAIGFLLNLLGNVYYELFVVHTVAWSNVDHAQVYSIVLLLIGLVGFLNFFISDYKNDLELDKSFFKRFLDYFFYQFTPGKIIRVLTGIYILMILVGFLILIYILLLQATSVLLATLTFLVAFVAVYLKERKPEFLNKFLK